MLYDIDKTLCFTGHRYYAAAPGETAWLDEAVEAAWADGYRTFVSGMAPGFDLAAAEAVVRLKSRRTDVGLVAAVPFRGQAAGYSEEDKRRYGELLAAADCVEVLSERYSHGCYYVRDDWMTERSSRLVCWYDGSQGGTRYTVKSALRGGLGIVNIYRDLFDGGVL